MPLSTPGASSSAPLAAIARTSNATQFGEAVYLPWHPTLQFSRLDRGGPSRHPSVLKCPAAGPLNSPTA